MGAVWSRSTLIVIAASYTFQQTRIADDFCCDWRIKGLHWEPLALPSQYITCYIWYTMPKRILYLKCFLCWIGLLFTCIIRSCRYLSFSFLSNVFQRSKQFKSSWDATICAFSSGHERFSNIKIMCHKAWNDKKLAKIIHCSGWNGSMYLWPFFSVAVYLFQRSWYFDMINKQ